MNEILFSFDAHTLASIVCPYLTLGKQRMKRARVIACYIITYNLKGQVEGTLLSSSDDTRQKKKKRASDCERQLVKWWSMQPLLSFYIFGLLALFIFKV